MEFAVECCYSECRGAARRVVANTRLWFREQYTQIEHIYHQIGKYLRVFVEEHFFFHARAFIDFNRPFARQPYAFRASTATSSTLHDQYIYTLRALMCLYRDLFALARIAVVMVHLYSAIYDQRQLAAPCFGVVDDDPGLYNAAVWTCK